MTSPRRRERRGRGRRGPLVPALARLGATQVRLPVWRSRADVFEDLVHEQARALHRRWGAQLGDLQLVVEDVPPAAAEDPADSGTVSDGAAGGVALAHARPGRIVVYRRPLELRADGPEDLADLVHEVLVEAVADLLGLDPDEVDPGQG